MKNGILPISCFATLIFSAQAWSQDTLLGSFGNTQLQKDTGDAVQTTCGGFVESGADRDEIPLFFTCAAMVSTARDLSGEGGQVLSLDITDEELAVSLQQIATEEFAATESLATEISSSRMDPVITRLAELRSGVKGFSIAGLLPGADAERDAIVAGHDQSTPLGGAAGDPESRLGGFINASYGTGDRDDTDRTDSFDFDSYNFVAGLDYRFGDNFVLGGAINYYEVDSDFNVSPTVSGGGVTADGWGVSVFGTWYQDAWYVDGVVGYASSSYDSDRSIFIPSNNPIVAPIEETAKASPDSDDYTVSVGGGYTFYNGGLSWGPYVRATYISVDIDSYTESGAERSGLNLRVDGQDWESFTTVLGAQFNWAINRDFGVIVPYGRIGWTHEFEDDATVMTAVYVDDPRENVLRASTDAPDSDYAELGVGVSAVFKGGFQAFINYDTLIGLDELTTNLFTVGLRKEF